MCDSQSCLRASERLGIIVSCLTDILPVSERKNALGGFSLRNGIQKRHPGFPPADFSLVVLPALRIAALAPAKACGLCLPVLLLVLPFLVKELGCGNRLARRVEANELTGRVGLIPWLVSPVDKLPVW